MSCLPPLPATLDAALSLFPVALPGSAVNEVDYPVFYVLDELVEPESQPVAEYVGKIQTLGMFIPLKQGNLYWHDDFGAVVAGGKVSEATRHYLLEVAQICWRMQWVARQVDAYLNKLEPVSHGAMQIEAESIPPQALKQLPGISRQLVRLRLLSQLMASPHVNGTELMGRSAPLRLLFNTLSDDRLELHDYYDAVWERLDLFTDTYEAWQEKLVEYRSFFYEAILELVIIGLLVVGMLQAAGGL